MPQAYVAKLAKKHNISIELAESKWEAAKKQAEKQGKSDNYGYITSIFQSMMNEQTNFKFSKLFELGLKQANGVVTEELDDLSDEDYDLYADEIDDSKEINYDELDGEDFDDPRDEIQNQQYHESTSILMNMICEKKKVKLNKLALKVYHRDYVKTKDKPYRKYDKNKHKHEKQAGVTEGVFDYVKGVGSAAIDQTKNIGRSLSDIHQSGKRESMFSEISNAVHAWFDTIVKYNQIKKQLAQINQPTQVGEGAMDYLRGAGQEISNKFNNLGNSFKKIHNVGKQRSFEADKKQLIELANQQAINLVKLLNKYGSNSSDVLKQTWKDIPNNIRLDMGKKIKQIQAQLATQSIEQPQQQQSVQQSTQRDPRLHASGLSNENKGNESRRQQRYNS